MLFHYVTIKDGKKRLVWSALLVFVSAAFAVVIAAAEAFWYFFTGGFSPLVGGFALVAAILLVIRVVGASLAGPVVIVDAEFDAP
jgi:hypothetical protein